MKEHQIIIAGGGIAGLTCLHYLKKAGLDAILLEAGPRVGGKILTYQKQDWVDDLGPNGFLTSRQEILDLVEDLGLSHRLIYADPGAAKRYVYINSVLKRIPETPPMFIKSDLISLKGKLSVLSDLFHSKTKDPEKDETVREFSIRHFGKEVYEKIIDPGFKGIYAESPDNLSALSCGRILKDMEISHGSVIRGLIAKQKASGSSMKKTRLASFDKGMAVLTDRMAELYSDSVFIDRMVTRVCAESGKYIVETENESFAAETLILAGQANLTAGLLADADKTLADEIAGIRFKDVAIWIARVETDARLDGFGYLIPTGENSPVLGCLWSSSIFPNARGNPDAKSVRFILSEMPENPDQVCMPQLEKGFGKKFTVRDEFSYLWKSALPVYVPGHNERLKKLERLLEKHKNLHLTGFSYRGVALGDSIRNAAELAEKIINPSKA